MLLPNTSSLARLVVIDGLRRYALIGLVLLAFGLEIGGIYFMDFIPRDIGKVSGDFVLSVGHLTGFLFLLFHAVQVMAWDEERRTIHTFLARPISRSQYVIGIFFGLAALLLFLNVILGTVGFGVLTAIKLSTKESYFIHLSFANYLFSWLGLFCIELFILSIIMLFSGMVRGGFPVLLLTVSYYFICTGLPVVREATANRPEAFSTFVPTLLKWLSAFFPDFSRFDFKTFITSDAVINPFQGLCIDLAVLFLYLIVVLWAAALVYQRRDLQ